MSRHQPAETTVHTVTVDCARSGPEQIIEDYAPAVRQITLADVEGFCAELRRLGADDGLVLNQADGLIVTLDRQ